MSAIARYYGHLYLLLGTLVAVLIAFMAVGITVDVVLRNAGFGVIAWMLEATEYSLFVATFMGAPWVLRKGAHVRVDVVVNVLPPGLSRAAEVFANLTALAVAGVLFYYAFRVGATSHAEGARAIKEFIFPEWWIFAVVVASAALLIVEIVLRLWRALRPMGTPGGEH
jgi:TRAP-type C4-dicarboxylate transport system permease small subunit